MTATVESRAQTVFGLLAIDSRILGHTKTVKEYLWAGMIVSKAEAHPSHTAALEKTHFHQFDWERRLIGRYPA
jgi:hypothetical protein